MKPSHKHFIAEQVLKWFHQQGRQFPWRVAADPYHVLVAELLLRRTTARQVAAMYNIFISRFPSLTTLAMAEEKDVLDVTQRLGIRARAGILRAAAQAIISEFKGEIPKSRVALSKIPGIGTYTADAILCLAFREPVPLVDSATTRLVARLFAFANSLGIRRQYKLAYQTLATILPPSQAKEFNLGILDIASTVCRPKRPQCDICPLNTCCASLNTCSKERCV